MAQARCTSWCSAAGRETFRRGLTVVQAATLEVALAGSLPNPVAYAGITCNRSRLTCMPRRRRTDGGIGAFTRRFNRVLMRGG